MIELLGPTYKYNGEILTKPEFIWINDHCFDEQDQCFHVKKLLDSSSINNFGWKSRLSLDEGLEITYKWFLDNLNSIRG